MPNRPSLFDPQAVRDDSGGDYGVWSNPENQSWYDWLKMKASDVQEAGKNVQSGLLSALSPYGAEGWQVPPAIQEPINAFHRLGENSVFPDGRLGIPNPSNVDNQNDVLTGLLSLYGGNALNPASVIPKGALASGALRTADEAPLRMYHGTAADVPFETFKPSADGSFGPGVYLSDNPAVASRYALEQNNSRVFPLDVQGPLASMDDYLTALHANGRDPNAALKVLRDQGYTGVTGDLGSLSNPQNVTSMFKPGSVRSATTGETLFSDTGKPSLFGAALAPYQQEPRNALLDY